MTAIQPLRAFTIAMTRLVEAYASDESVLLSEGADLLRNLVRRDDWLPESYAAASSNRYRQYLLHCDPLERFCIVSFVWLPTQRTPIHDHLTWGLIGQLRGEEVCEEFDARQGEAPRSIGVHRMSPGDVDRVSPRIGDVHAVSHGGVAGTAVSIHVYGANIGTVRRHVFDAATGAAAEFVSGFDNDRLPNLWAARSPIE
jgi:predicted metal-dependent enzyme (double-stranded beta helix superfamily)